MSQPADIHPSRDEALPQGPPETVLVVAPTGMDAQAASAVLREVGISALPATEVQDLQGRLASGISALVIAQEALTPDTASALAGVLVGQPEWSDLPVIVLAGAGAADSPTEERLRALLPAGNITVLERPFRKSTLTSAVAMALRARRRQHQLAVHLRERARAAAQLREANARLEDANAELHMHRSSLEEIIADRTEEIRVMHEQLRTNERMASLGTFSAGLGHDLSNLLLPLRTRLSLLLARTDLPKDVMEDLAAVASPAAYLSKLTTALRHFATDPEHSWDSPGTSLDSWHAEVYALIRTIIPPRVELKVDIAPNLPDVAIPSHALTQSVFNLVHNARDAVLAARPDGGGWIAFRCARGEDRNWLNLSVSDNGAGMTEVVRARCLEPFFTTKVRQKGTGLGLAMVQGIARKAGGRISIASTPGAGTTVDLWLPAVRGTNPASAGPARRAHVTLTDARAQGYLTSILQMLGLNVRPESPGVHPESFLWVADAHTTSPDAAASFLSAQPSRRMVVLGCEPSWSIDRVTHLPKNAPFMEMRRVVVENALALATPAQ